MIIIHNQVFGSSGDFAGLILQILLREGQEACQTFRDKFLRFKDQFLIL